MKIGSQLDDAHKETLTQFLNANLYVFAWKHPNHKQVRQKKRSMDVAIYEALKEEVDRLLEI